MRHVTGLTCQAKSLQAEGSGRPDELTRLQYVGFGTFVPQHLPWRWTQQNHDFG